MVSFQRGSCLPSWAPVVPEKALWWTSWRDTRNNKFFFKYFYNFSTPNWSMTYYFYFYCVALCVVLIGVSAESIKANVANRHPVYFHNVKKSQQGISLSLYKKRRSDTLMICSSQCLYSSTQLDVHWLCKALVERLNAKLQLSLRLKYNAGDMCAIQFVEKPQMDYNTLCGHKSITNTKFRSQIIFYNQCRQLLRKYVSFG